MRVEGQEPASEGGLDTLYTAQTWNRSLNSECGDAPSPVDGAIIGARYESTPADTLAGRQHGRVVYLNFQPWWFERQPDGCGDRGGQLAGHGAGLVVGA